MVDGTLERSDVKLFKHTKTYRVLHTANKSWGSKLPVNSGTSCFLILEVYIQDVVQSNTVSTARLAGTQGAGEHERLSGRLGAAAAASRLRGFLRHQ